MKSSLGSVFCSSILVFLSACSPPTISSSAGSPTNTNPPPLLTNTASAGSVTTANPLPGLTVEMRDGSRVVGRSVDDTVSVHAATVGDLKLAWSGIRSIEYAASTDTARLTATNGDGFAVQLDGDTLRLTTDFGKTELPVKMIRSIKVLPAKPKAAVVAADKTGFRLTIDLRDGSHFVGKGLDTALDFHSATMGDLKLTWAGIRSINFAAEQSPTARLTATNGDAYEVEFANPTVRVATSFGNGELPVKSIRSIKVSALGGQGQSPDGLVLFWSGTGDGQDNVGTDPDTLTALSPSGTVKVANNPDLVSMQQTRQITIEMWIKPDAIPRDFPVLLSKGGNQPPGAYGGYELTLNAAGDNDLVFVSAGCCCTTHNAYGRWINSHLGEWIHVAFALDDRNKMATFYANGQPTNDEFNLGISNDLNFNLPNNLYIGAPDPASHRNRSRFVGEMRDVKLFNRVLTPEEIKTDYEAGHPD